MYHDEAGHYFPMFRPSACNSVLPSISSLNLGSLILRKDELKPQIQRALDDLSVKLDPFQLFWQHSPPQQKLSLLHGCQLASGNRPANQRHRHQQQHERIRESIVHGDDSAPQEFQSCFQKWCPFAPRESMAVQPPKAVLKETDLSDEEAEDEVKERQALQERLEKLCTWTPGTLKNISVFSPPPAKASIVARGPDAGYTTDVWTLDTESRARLLGMWLQSETSISWPLVEALCKENDEIQARINELERHHMAGILRDADIVGCTISGASIRCDLLADVDFPVVLVEEAAEILEPQLLAALPPSCKQLILIGDHFQLRPAIQSYQLGRERNFDRSMIERLFASEEADYPKATLNKQNRMRDEFLGLLRPFYPKLQTNHQRIRDNQMLTMAGKSMFFVTMRSFSEVEATERRSPTNPEEAKMITAFCQHILREGYKATETSVLSMYTGQVSLLRSLLRNARLEDIKCSSVDRYQGDENNFVLVSLVRSNAQAKVGFVSERNRLIVALSRARCGVYLFGNDEILKRKSKEWREVLSFLNDQGCVGHKLPLLCPRHPDVMLEVGQECHHVCDEELDCGHRCHQACHREGNHPRCDQEVEVTLACGHNRSCKCWEKNEAFEQIRCSQLVEFHHEICEHFDIRKCWDKKKRCETAVAMCCDNCGEESEVQCWVKKDSPESFRCSKPCTRKMSCAFSQFIRKQDEHPVPPI